MPSSIVILTGAGISAKSGVATFRDPDGIWAKYDVEEVATPRAFARDPAKVHDFYNLRRGLMSGVKPNAAHFALARLEQEFAGKFLLVTQNIDDLHERAGSTKLIHMHGELASALCEACDERNPWRENMSTQSRCPSCQAARHMRPDVVWFGEFPYHMEQIEEALSACDVFVSIGTSGTVYPAAGFVELAYAAGAHTVELNLEPSHDASLFAEKHHGKATEVVPAFVERILAGERTD